MQQNNFEVRLTECLKKFYGGKLPAFSTIARDFTLHSPQGLKPLSVEAPRKWVRGTSLPSLERLQTLANWLGPEILEPLNGNFLDQPSHTGNGHVQSADELQSVADLLKQLTPEELESVKQLLGHLVSAHEKHRGNGRG